MFFIRPIFQNIKNSEILLSIVALWTLAVSKPLLDVIGNSPEYWVANNIDRWFVILFTIVLCFAFPLVCTLAVIALKIRFQFISNSVFRILFTILAFISIYYNSSLIFGKSIILIISALPLAFITVRFYLCTTGFRQFLSIMSFLAILTPSSFLFLGPTKSFIFPTTEYAGGIGPVATLDVPLVLIIFDEMSLSSILNDNGSIDSRLFPNLSRLSQASTWYKNASTNFGSTERAIPTFLSGKFLTGEAAAVSYKQCPKNLFSLIRAPDGVFAMESITKLCPTHICEPQNEELSEAFRQVLNDSILIYQNIVIPDYFSSSIAPIPHRFENLAGTANEEINLVNDGDPTVQKVSNWFSSGNRKSIVYLHFGLLPHAPYTRNPDGSQYSLSETYAMAGWDPKQHKWAAENEFVTSQAFQRYLLQAMYADTILGKIMDCLYEKGLFDESIFVVAADHGIGFTPNAKRRTASFDDYSFGEINAVPLLIKASHQKNAIPSMHNIEFIDVLPTLLSLLGLSNKEIMKLDFDGQPAKLESEREDKIFGGKHYTKDLFSNVLASRNRIHKNIYISKTKEGGYFPLVKKYYGFIGIEANASISSGTTIEIDNLTMLSELENVNLKSNFIPNYISGRLVDGTADTIAIAVNMKIADVVDVFIDSNGQRRFSSVFDKNFLIPGKNQLQFFSFSSNNEISTKIELKHINFAADLFKFSDNSLIDSKGRKLRRDQSRLVGGIDEPNFKMPGHLHIGGWMGDKSKWKPPIAYLIKYRDEFFISKTNIPRPDLVKISPDMFMTGFGATINLRGKPFDKNHLKIFLIFDKESYAEMQMKPGFQSGE